MTTERKYLPTLAELIDRLSIVLQKSIFVPNCSDIYHREAGVIMHDIDAALDEVPGPMTAERVRAILMIMLANRFIWENEDRARAGGSDQDKRLKLTHSVNGVRQRAKNIISAGRGERTDIKVDCLAADLPAEFGNWDVFRDQG